jgi:hypothetical protein
VHATTSRLIVSCKFRADRRYHNPIQSLEQSDPNAFGAAAREFVKNPDAAIAGKPVHQVPFLLPCPDDRVVTRHDLKLHADCPGCDRQAMLPLASTW